ncbi:hypothetical protein Mgra_00007297 [Meloidogyne graminicola]|uniref:Uncharacterized protein n=1 Tax=Meloidogyne graminicola TaxID=189291 RepID=A0A8S9ZJ29_9BILA|nr:hypothetical protein Mgra_00007297 [Meloidogyne graminicola]
MFSIYKIIKFFHKNCIIYLIFFLFNFVLCCYSQDETGKLPKVTILKMSTEEGFKIYEQWINKAFASLLSAFLQAKINSNELPQQLPDNFSKCFLKTESIPSMIKCISQLLEGKFNEDKIYTKRFQRYINNKENKLKSSKNVYSDKDLNYDSFPNIKIKNCKDYILSESKRTQGLSPVGGLARILMANFIKRKNRGEIKLWQKTAEEIKELQLIKEKMNKKLKSQNIYEKVEAKQPLEKKILKLVNDGIRLSANLVDNKKEKVQKEARTNKVDLLSPRFLSVTESKTNDKISNLLSPSLFSLHDKGNGLEKELSLPKIMNATKLTGRDQQEWLNLIMESSGVNEQVENIKSSLSINRNPTKSFNQKEIEQRYENEFSGLYLTRKNVKEMYGDYEDRKIATWEELDKKFNERQRDELEKTGYSLLNEDQLKFLYGPNSPFNDSVTLTRLLKLINSKNKNNKSSRINQFIEEDIKKIAEMRSFDIRQHDVVLSPAYFRPAILNPTRTSQPFILSPFLFSPTILSPTIMGPAILSPRVFSPTILTPRIMTPLILSPFIFSTILLSPIIMQPFILSPGLINSVILSPFIMNPMIMSSQIMHPFILSPLVMTPGILNPSALSPLVLSPFVLNPQVWSPKFFSGLILSPYALSPVLMSPTYAYIVILSPICKINICIYLCFSFII